MIDKNSAPYGATHYHHKDGYTWWYKKQDGNIYIPSPNIERWLMIEQGRDKNHDKWLAENLTEIS